MSQMKTDLDLAIAQSGGDAQNILNAVSTLLTEQVNAFARLEAKIAAGTPEDLTQEISDLKAMSTSLQAALPPIQAAIAVAQSK